MRRAAWMGVAGLVASAAAGAATLPGHVPAAVATGAAARVGDADAGQPLHLAISLVLRDDAGLTRLVRELYDPASPQYRQYLSVAAFADRFGQSAADWQRTADWLAARGMRVGGMPANRLMVEADTTVADAARAFGVRFGRYRDPASGRVFTAPDRDPSVDGSLPVSEIIGLDDAVLPQPRLVRPRPGQAPAGVGGSGPGGFFIGTDIHAAYYPTGTLTGAGQSVGLMELAPFNPDGPAMFFSMFGPKNTVKIVPISTDGSTPTCPGACNDGEQDLDIEYAVSMAPGLDKVQVYVAQSPESVLNRMASDSTSKQLSTSWGWNERFKTDDALFREFAAQGQTNLTASGDHSSLQASGPWPEEDANIVAVGGTNLVTNGPGGPWKAETGWSGSAGGPSLDKSIKIESYQLPFINASNKGSTTLRNVPDVAAIAGPQFYFCYSGGCGGGAEGTSFASPIWAGFVALANQRAAAAAKAPVGFINPAVYALAGGTKYKGAFHDIVKGRSGKFSCTPSYDLVTGLGSIHGQGLIDALVGK